MKGFTGKGHNFPAGFGFTGSAGRVPVKSHMRKAPSLGLSKKKEGNILNKADGGPVQEPKIHRLDEAGLVKRRDVLTEEDREGGGRSNLRAGFAKGGKAHGANCTCSMCSGGYMSMGGSAHSYKKGGVGSFKHTPKIK